MKKGKNKAVIFQVYNSVSFQIKISYRSRYASISLILHNLLNNICGLETEKENKI